MGSWLPFIIQHTTKGRGVLSLGKCLIIVLVVIAFSGQSGRSAQAQSTPGEATVIDYTENNKAMGYPDSRKIVRDSRGALYVAYRKKYKIHTTTAYHIFVAKSTDNGATWRVLNEGRPIEAVGDTNQRVPALAIDRQDHLHVVWYGPDATQPDTGNLIKYARSMDYGESWSAWQNIGFVTGYQGQTLWQEHPTIFIDTANRLYVVWEGRDAQYAKSGQIKFTQSRDGGHSWTPWVNLAPSSASRSRPVLVATSNATGQPILYVFAYGNQQGQQQILYTTSDNEGGTWSSWQPVVPADQDQRHVSAAVDNTGTIHVVWRQLPFRTIAPADTSAQIYYASFDGQRWQLPIRVGPHIGIDQTYPSLAVDTDQTVWITWLETTAPYDFPHDAPTSGTLYYVAKAATGWSTPQPYAAGTQNLYPSLRRELAGGGAGAEVVWLEAGTHTNAIRFAQLPRPHHFLPANNVADNQPTPSQTTQRLAWVEAASLPLPLLVLGTWLGGSADWQAVQLWLLLVAVVSCYLIGKALFGRWLP